MNVIDIIGPSGAGKSTLRKSVQKKNDSIIGGESGRRGAVQRTLPIKIPLTKINRKVCDLLWDCQLQKQHFLRFISSNTTYLSLFDELLKNRNDKSHILKLFIEKSARYNLYMSQTHDDETVILDDSILQICIQILHKKKDLIDEVVSTVSEPNILIVLDTPPQICLDRQEARERGRSSFFKSLSNSEAISLLEDIRNVSLEISAKYENKDTKVLVIDGTKNQSRCVDLVNDFINSQTYFRQNEPY